MSYDVVALVHGAPDVQAVVSQMIAGGEPVRLVPADPAVHLCGEDDRPMVSVEEPQYIQVPGEVERLVGPEMAAQAGTPVWWVEVRAASAIDGASDVARRFAEQIVRSSGGVLWAPAAEPVRDEEPAVDTPDWFGNGQPEPEPGPPPDPARGHPQAGEDGPPVAYDEPPADQPAADGEGNRP